MGLAQELQAPIQETRIAGRYLLLEQIGAGGMASVHRALDETTGRVVALKQLNSSLARRRRRTAEALFEREYHTLARLKHPRIIEAYEYGLTPEGRYYTMELLDGKDLSQLGVLDYPAACRLLRDVASSLALIHAHRLIHRDVSPRNIRLTQDGRPKLIDFGALSPFGLADEVIGTPLCLAPEVLHAQPLDQRTDLYALGAVAYWLLTGRHAYPARRMQDVLVAWETPPVPPSHFARDIPRELEALVLSLLSLEPLGRPPNAAAVIDQLTAIAGLEPEEHEYAAESYLLSSRTVGRQTELDWIDKRVKRALSGRGGQVAIEGAPGIGKTCLLREASIAARLRGAVALKADAQATAEPFGVAISLALELLDACPDVARRAAAENAGLLVQLSPLLQGKLGDVPAVPVPHDPNERRARFQTALHRWFLEVARERVLFVAVDNVQAADDNSAAFLAGLGRDVQRTQLVLVVTLRAGESVVAGAAVRMLRERSSRLKLAALSAEACEQLVKSLFGDVQNSARVAQLLFERSAGVPQQCMDLAHLLVRRKIAKYGAGTWVLPQDVAADELPSRAEELLATRLAGLSTAALGLAEALSIHSKPVTLERCLALVEGQSESAIFSALDELVAEQILRSEAGSYRFAHDALRRAVAEKLDDSQRRAGHVRAAEALLASDPDGVAARIEAAVHLLDAGEENRGAEMLAKLGMGLTSAVDFNAGTEAVVALQRALESFERQRRSEHEIAALLFPMMKLAYYSPHWKLVLKHGERALEIGVRITGLAFAQKLRLFGRERALKVGLKRGGIGFARQQRRGLGYDLKAAIVACCGILPAVVGTAATCLDTERVARIKRIVEPLTLFGPEHVAGILYNWAPLELLITQGREGEAREMVERCIALSEQPHVRGAMGEANWKSQHGGLLFVRALFDTYAVGDAALRGLEEIEQLGIRVWAMAADQIRMLYHALRGESEEVQRYRERVELFAVQGSTTWQAEMFWPALLLSADVLTGDAIAARRTSEQLARRAKDVDFLKKYADLAQASYLLLRGEIQPAIALYEKILPEFPLRRRIAYERVRAYYARALNLAGDHARAKAVVLEVIAGMVEADHRLVVHFLEPQRQLALAEAGLGNHAEAIRILDGLLAKHGHADNRLLIGLLHQARAEVALMSGDAGAFELHLREMEQRFRSTRNPALIAQCERLLDRAARLGIRTFEPQMSQESNTVLGHSAIVSGTVAELSAAADPRSYALQLILTRAQAKSGFLYIRRLGVMHLVAASGPNEPPSFLEAALKELADKPPPELDPSHRSGTNPSSGLDSSRARTTGDHTSTTGPSAPTGDEDSNETALIGPLTGSSSEPSEISDELDETQAISDAKALGNTVFLRSMPPPSPWGDYQLVLLDARQGEKRIVVGGVILEAKPQQLARLSKELLRGMAQVLHHRELTTTQGTLL